MSSSLAPVLRDCRRPGSYLGSAPTISMDGSLARTFRIALRTISESSAMRTVWVIELSEADDFWSLSGPSHANPCVHGRALSVTHAGATQEIERSANLPSATSLSNQPEPCAEKRRPNSRASSSVVVPRETKAQNGPGFDAFRSFEIVLHADPPNCRLIVLRRI
jgi:hypothetical protein